MEIKKEYTDALLFFRLGDFYELFFDDAIIAARELEIALTGRNCGLDERAPMCGVPHHSADGYINKLLEKGYKVAICEQMEDASSGKGIVERDVIRVITPGTLIDTELLEEKKNNFLMSIYGTPQGAGVSYVDISTGDLFATEITSQIVNGSIKKSLYDEICKIRPKEIIYNIELDKLNDIITDVNKQFNVYVSEFESWRYDYDYALRQLYNQFNIITVEGLGFESDHLAIQSTGALIDYLKLTQKRTLGHISRITVYTLKDRMLLDINTRRNLELTETIRDRELRGSLLWVLDKTMTSMGGRMLRRWIEEPLLEVEKINNRLNAVEELKKDYLLRGQLRDSLRCIYDLERLAGKIAYGTINPRDLIALSNSLRKLPIIKELLTYKEASYIKDIKNNINCHTELKELIENAIMEEPPITIKEGNIIKDGYSKDIDELRWITREGKDWISNLEKEEQTNTGIRSLKIGYNKIFGYYIEITNANLHLVPQNYIRKQTLANSERYITEELKEKESKVLGAEEKLMLLEYELFLKIRQKVKDHVKKLQDTAKAIAKLDSIYSLSQVAEENNYVQPSVNNNKKIEIIGGRHPVVEKMIEEGIFIPNNTIMDGKNHRISIITGPNMAGKSTYMRQVALIVLMAQIGSYIPAQEATIGVVDRIFTRIGASDDLSQGQSTFMVEMSEVANIVNNATDNSLLILDEIGRGTSTFDGLSIAWAVIEYISNTLGCRTFFSTHYHELTELEGVVENVKNYRINVQEDGDDIVFLRKVVEGSADKSYGIQVAKLAGLPQNIIYRAQDLLANLEKKAMEQNELTSHADNEEQLVFIPQDIDKIISDIKDLNLLETTPLQAINHLHYLQERINNLWGHSNE